MNKIFVACLALLLLAVLEACQPLSPQSPPVPSSPSTNSKTMPSHKQDTSSTQKTQGTPIANQSSSRPVRSAQPSPPVTGGQRGQYVWNKAIEGVSMGGSIAGPYGAGVGMVLGGLFGLVTADSYYEKLNKQILVEKAKDKELENQLEKEIEHQRELESEMEKLDGRPRVTSSLGRKSHLSLDKDAMSASPDFPFKNVSIKDVNQDGTPDLWIYMDPKNPDNIIRKEEDNDWNGRMDTWSTYADGKLIRREEDTNGDGKRDRFFIYRDETLIREERDEKGEGQPNLRAYYDRGRLTKVEKDLSGDGKMDLWVFYDKSQSKEVILREERDFNNDGAVDLWSYYEKGKLVQRDVSAVGLDFLSGKEQHVPKTPATGLSNS